eukprot:2407277-Rhodomonas_salina.1
MPHTQNASILTGPCMLGVTGAIPHTSSTRKVCKREDLVGVVAERALLAGELVSDVGDVVGLRSDTHRASAHSHRSDQHTANDLTSTQGCNALTPDRSVGFVDPSVSWRVGHHDRHRTRVGDEHQHRVSFVRV